MIRLAKPNIDKDAIDSLTDVLISGNLVQGEKVRQFEKTLEEYLGVKYAIVVSSGTAALHLSLLALNIKQDDEIIIPAFTYPATANAVEIIGAKPVLVDISLDDFCCDIKKMENLINSKTKAIMPVHEFGQVADMQPLISIAEKYGLKIVEDSACALGAEYNGKKAGTMGDIGCFSFHPRKALTTGEGGVAVTDNKDLAERLRAYRNHGINVSKEKFDFKYAGLNYRMTDFQAVLGIHQLVKLKTQIKYKLEQAREYDRIFKDFELVDIPSKINGRVAVYQSYHILLNNKINRDDIITALKKVGIETNLGAYAIHMITFYKKKYNFNNDDFPNSKIAYENGLVCPIGDHISFSDIKKITSQILGLIK